MTVTIVWFLFGVAMFCLGFASGKLKGSIAELERKIQEAKDINEQGETKYDDTDY